MKKIISLCALIFTLNQYSFGQGITLIDANKVVWMTDVKKR